MTKGGKVDGPWRPVWLMQPIPYFGEELEKEEWVLEPKIDGWRMQVFKTPKGDVELWGRRLEKNPMWTQKLIEIRKVGEEVLPRGILIDTELYSTGGRRFIPSLFAKKPKVNPIVYVFDIVFWKGKFIGSKPLVKRRKILEMINWKAPFIIVPQYPLTDLKKEVVDFVKKGYEGIVIKRLDSSYRIGKGAPEATHNWRKIKGS